MTMHVISYTPNTTIPEIRKKNPSTLTRKYILPFVQPVRDDESYIDAR